MTYNGFSLNKTQLKDAQNLITVFTSLKNQLSKDSYNFLSQPLQKRIIIQNSPRKHGVKTL